MKKIYSLGFASAILFSGCSAVPHVNIQDNESLMKLDMKDVDFSENMKKSTICVDPHSLDGDLTVIRAAKKGKIKKVKYVTKENHFDTKYTLLRGNETVYTQKCITVYGE